MSQHIDGIQGFSEPMEDLIIWAADSKHEAHSVRALLTHMNIQFTPCLGSYKGETGLSYITTETSFIRIAHILCDNQESIVRLGSKDSRNRHRATLIFWRDQLGGSRLPPVELGQMRSVPVHEAQSRDTWTIPLIQNNGEILAFVCDHVNKFGEPIIISQQGVRTNEHP
jgi:hypothetical protein